MTEMAGKPIESRNLSGFMAKVMETIAKHGKPNDDRCPSCTMPTERNDTRFVDSGWIVCALTTPTLTRRQLRLRPWTQSTLGLLL